MTSMVTELIDWARVQDELGREDNPRAEAIERPLVREPRPEQPLNFWRIER
jgi:hypothetical protein